MAGLGDCLKIGYTQVVIPEGAFCSGQLCGDIHLAECKLVSRRMAGLSTSSPWPIRAWRVCLIPGAYRASQAREVESWFHDHFSSCKMRGEWFNVSRARVAIHPALEAHTVSTRKYLPSPWELVTADEPFRKACRDAVWRYGPDGQLRGSLPGADAGCLGDAELVHAADSPVVDREVEPGELAPAFQSGLVVSPAG